MGGAGGGIFNDGSLTVTGSTFSDNVSAQASAGGGIFNVGTLTVTNSTFSGNSAIFNIDFEGGGNGGGIYNGGTATVTNSTFSGNSAGAGGGIFSSGDLTVANSILAASSPSGNCRETVNNNGGFNISDDDTCGFGTSTGADGQTIGDNVNPQLDPNGLQNNGGPTETIALGLNSPAIGAIPLADCTVNTDQRGASRPAPGYDACSIGAYEYGDFIVPTPTPTATPTGLVTLAPTSLDFGTVAVGKSSVASGVTLSNGTAKTITIRLTSIGRDFKIVSTTCSSTVSAGASCGYSIGFRPLTAGSKSEVFRVTDNTGKGSPTVALHGLAAHR